MWSHLLVATYWLHDLVWPWAGHNLSGPQVLHGWEWDAYTLLRLLHRMVMTMWDNGCEAASQSKNVFLSSCYLCPISKVYTLFWLTALGRFVMCDREVRHNGYRCALECLHISLIWLISALKGERRVTSLSQSLYFWPFWDGNVPGHQDPNPTFKERTVIVLNHNYCTRSHFQVLKSSWMFYTCVFLVTSKYWVWFPFQRWGSRGLRGFM